MTPINVDRNVSIADYRGMDDRHELRVTSIFNTIQGEGPFSGLPAVFLRLSGCNIGAKQDCPWCDTAFAFDAGKVMNLTAVAEAIRIHRAKLVVVTGGEPLLQWASLLKLYRHPAFDSSYRWQLETNGLLLDMDILNAAPDPVSFVVSPKVPHSKTAYRKVPISWYTARDRIHLKYVVEDDPASPYHLPGPVCVNSMTPFTTYISGMTVYRRAPVMGEVASIWDETLIDHEATGRNYRHAAKLVRLYGDPYRLSYQTHLFGAVE